VRIIGLGKVFLEHGTQSNTCDLDQREDEFASDIRRSPQFASRVCVAVLASG
jgi:hypothetical protein